MKKILQTEEAAQFCLAILGLYLQPLSLSWWSWIVVFLSPDISMLGYLVNPRIGAISYNLFHHKALAIAVGVTGYYLSHPVWLLAGLLLLAHACFDRMLGYGLKHSDGFSHTHLGRIGKAG